MKLLSFEMGFQAKLDDGDYERLKHHKYYIRGKSGGFYAVRKKYENGKRKYISLHHDVLQVPNLYPDFCIDHINGDTLDCRNSNLQIVTQAQNTRKCRPRKGGTSKYKGVSYKVGKAKRRRPWRTTITINDKTIYRYFEDEFSAMLAYNILALCFFSPYAYFNRWDGPTEKERNIDKPV
jgi:hypothetical protein